MLNSYQYVSCRKTQEQILLSVLPIQSRTSYGTGSLFLYGHTATGKTTCLRNIASQCNLSSVFIHCAELYSPRHIYEHILQSINEANTAIPKCDNMNDFVRILRKLMEPESKTLCLMFEKAERLRFLPANILSSFLRLQELSGCNVIVILQSELVWEKFRLFSTGSYEPICIHFPDYSKDDLIEILSGDYSEIGINDIPVETYAAYCQLIVNVFYSATKNLRELKYLASMNFNKYIEPIMSKTISADNSRALWKNIEPQLKLAMSSVFLHEVSSRQWEKSQSQNEDAVQLTGSHVKQTVELPYFSKYLLIAAYLASYNPATSDKRFFAKNAGRLRKRNGVAKKSDRTSSQILGPKAFQLDRLMAIFYSIVEGKVHPTTHLYTQISNLVSLRLLGLVSNETQIDAPKYKCLVNFDFIQNIGRTVQFDIVHYLYDFVN